MPLVSKNFSDIITFTRASSATFVGSNGLIQSTPQSKNLLTWTEAFDNAAWSKVNATVTADASVAPDGTTTADKLIANTTLDQHRCDQTPSSTAVAQTFSVYVKAAGYGFVGLRLNLTGALFDLSTGATSNVSAGITAQSTSVGNGWYRCSITKATGVANDVCRINISDGSAVAPNFTGNGTDGIFIWGAQLEVGSTATDYTKNDGGLFPPRFDYDPVTLAAKGLLIEEQRTNLLTYSEDFSNAAWQKVDVTISANSAVAPDGATTADKMIESTAAGVSHYVNQLLGTIGALETLTVYAKPAGRNWVYLQIGSFGNSAYFDVQNGTVGTVSGAGATASIENVGNGWFRCRYTQTRVGSSVNIFAPATSNGGLSYTGDGTSGLFIWGAQLEAGAFPTSYIPTVASQVTRSADVASVNTLSPWYNATEGTLYGEGSSFGLTTNGNGVSGLSDGTTSNRFGTYATSTSNAVFSYMLVGGSLQASLSTASAAANAAVFKSGFAYKANDFAASVNGGAALTDTSGSIATVDRLLIGSIYNVNFNQLNGHIRRITYYPRRLSNAELQAITA